MANYIFSAPGHTAPDNVARDEWFLDHIGTDDRLLYFFVNRPSVIIGKNQNPWKECDLDAMKTDGVLLARRVSGGGAVYHDEGNLNYSFLVGKNHDPAQLMPLVAQTLRTFGLICSFSGRNDLLLDGKKFSGCAYCARGGARMAHGTLLVSSDLQRLARYLTVDERKIRSKGVDSVRSRVCNLTERSPDLTIPALQNALKEAFAAYCGGAQSYVFDEEAKESFAQYKKRHRSRAWLLGETPRFDYQIDERYSFGGVQICLSTVGGRISGVRVFSDAMNENLAPRLETLLLGAPFDLPKIAALLHSAGEPEMDEIAESIRNLQ